MKWILGVDPGLDGGLAVLDPKDNTIITWQRMPTLKTKGGRQIDLFKLSDFFDEGAKAIRYMVIEDVHSMPNQGVASMFTFGKAYGIVLGMAAAFNIPQFHVQPAVWKGVMNLGRDKKDSIKKAKEIFPMERSITHGESEALLLAYFGKRFWR